MPFLLIELSRYVPSTVKEISCNEQLFSYHFHVLKFYVNDKNAICNSALKCYECFTREDCLQHENNHMVECNHASVQLAASHFNFLPNVMSQLPSNEFYCADYERSKYNLTVLVLKGCFYSTYNPCAFVSATENAETSSGYRCKYCNLADGCNSKLSLKLSSTELFHSRSVPLPPINDAGFM
uniref:CSON008267 protein n=1 Tax=Culicoides sonorensis TaxID=179676 RepID=A0A336MVH9_CULSO